MPVPPEMCNLAQRFNLRCPVIYAAQMCESLRRRHFLVYERPILFAYVQHESRRANAFGKERPTARPAADSDITHNQRTMNDSCSDYIQLKMQQMVHDYAHATLNNSNHLEFGLFHSIIGPDAGAGGPASAQLDLYDGSETKKLKSMLARPRCARARDELAGPSARI